MKVGFIGLGQMGRAIAANLLGAGHELTVWNRSADKAADLVAAGARLAATPADAAQGDVVMTMLADDAAVEAVVHGTDGILAAPALHVSHSTISVALAERLATDHAARAGFVSAPVFGRPPAAQAAKLFVVAAGEAHAVDRCLPLFEAIAQRVFRVGPSPAAANLVKLGGNFMIMAAVEAMAEAMTLVEAGGVDRRANARRPDRDAVRRAGLPHLRRDPRRGPLPPRRLHRPAGPEGHEPGGRRRNRVPGPDARPRRGARPPPRRHRRRRAGHRLVRRRPLGAQGRRAAVEAVVDPAAPWRFGRKARIFFF